MSFSFPDIDPNTQGAIYDVPVPLSRYLDNMYDAGQHDTILHSLNRMTEMSVADADETSPVLQPEEAQKKWGVGNLKFDQPIRESVARLMNQRKRDEMDREFFIGNGSSAKRFIPGMAAAMLGAVSNPVDLATMFIPFVGEEAAAAKATTAFGKVAARRLVTREALQSAFPKASGLAESMINGMAGQALFEVPVLASAMQDQANYTVANSVFNIGAGGAFAAALHGAGVLYKRLSRGTKEQMARQALNQLLNDEQIKVHNYVRVDENAIWSRIKFEEDLAVAKAYQDIDQGKIAKDLFEKEGLKVNPDTPAAFITPDGKNEIDHSHWTAKMMKFLDDNPDAVRAYHLSDGRIVTESSMSNHLGVPEDELTSEYFILGKDGMTSREEGIYDKYLEEGKSHDEAFQLIVADRQERALNKFMSAPDSREKFDAEYKKRIDEYVANERSKFEQEKQGRFEAEKQKEIDAQIAAGRTLPPEEVQKRIPSEKFEEAGTTDLDADIADLEKTVKQTVDAENKQNVFEKLSAKVDDYIKQLDKPNDKMFTGILGIEPLIAMVGKEVTKGLLIATREGLKLTGDLVKAIDHAMEWYGRQSKNAKVVETVTKETTLAKEEIKQNLQAAKDAGDEQAIEKWSKLLNPQQSRRGFLSTLGKVVGGLAVGGKLDLTSTAKPKTIKHFLGGSWSTVHTRIDELVNDELNGLREFALEYLDEHEFRGLIEGFFRENGLGEIKLSGRQIHDLVLSSPLGTEIQTLKMLNNTKELSDIIKQWKVKEVSPDRIMSEAEYERYSAIKNKQAEIYDKWDDFNWDDSEVEAQRKQQFADQKAKTDPEYLKLEKEIKSIESKYDFAEPFGNGDHIPIGEMDYRENLPLISNSDVQTVIGLLQNHKDRPTVKGVFDLLLNDEIVKPILGRKYAGLKKRILEKLKEPTSLSEEKLIRQHLEAAIQGEINGYLGDAMKTVEVAIKAGQSPQDAFREGAAVLQQQFMTAARHNGKIITDVAGGVKYKLPDGSTYISKPKKGPVDWHSLLEQGDPDLYDFGELGFKTVDGKFITQKEAQKLGIYDPEIYTLLDREESEFGSKFVKPLPDQPNALIEKLRKEVNTRFGELSPSERMLEAVNPEPKLESIDTAIDCVLRKVI